MPFKFFFLLYYSFIYLLIETICSEQKKYGLTPMKKAVDIKRLNELVSIGYVFLNMTICIFLSVHDLYIFLVR